MKKILFVEDDPGLMKGLAFALEKQKYKVICARTFREAEQIWLDKDDFDLVVLDVTLPDGTGYTLCEQIRQTSKMPIMFLTAADEETDIIMGLDMGADDYITKPFKLAVFLARVHAILRRNDDYNSEHSIYSANGITVDKLKCEVTKYGVLVTLTATEYKLLCLFMENPGIVLSQEQILSHLWDHEERYIDNSTLTVYIRRLRMKIEDDPSSPQRIVTVRGLGYKWQAGTSGAK